MHTAVSNTRHGFVRVLLAFLLAAAAVLVLSGHAVADLSVDGDSAFVAVFVDGQLDSDGDGLTDAVEAALGMDIGGADSDGDGLDDAWEVWHGLDPIWAGDYLADLDGDGLGNDDEYVLGTLPQERDSDGDGFWDGLEVDRGSDPTEPASFPVTDLRGDVDLDWDVDAMDVQFVINAALALDVPMPANANGVGEVNAVDVQTVINAALGL
jgi:thrombospondin type 3 repeat protein